MQSADNNIIIVFNHSRSAICTSNEFILIVCVLNNRTMGLNAIEFRVFTISSIIALCFYGTDDYRL